MKGNKETLFFPSIFNDVLAPVTLGPSSSNTVGPWRIGAIIRQFLEEEPTNVTIEMSEKGGFFDTLYSMSSDKGFIAGILGEDLLEIDFDSIYQLAKERNVAFEFIFSDKVERIPSEMAKLTVITSREILHFTGSSLGGGEVVISEINGQGYQIDGRKDVEVTIPNTNRICKIHSIYPLNTLDNPQPPFFSSDTMIKYAINNGLPLWKAALEYEKSITGEDYETILQLSRDTLKVAYDSIARGLKRGITFEGITTAKAWDFLEKKDKINQLNLGFADQGALEAMAIMEYSNGHGKIVCMPTGGASGIIPAAIKNAAEGLGIDFEEQVKALLVTGLLGVFYYPTHYHGSLGCQAEVGVATSMAAGGLASMMTDNPKLCEASSVLAMQCLIGQVCDPIEGYTQIPCIIRNVASVPMAMICANYGVMGMDAGVSLDEMAQAVLRVGEKIRDTRISDCGTCMCKRNK